MSNNVMLYSLKAGALCARIIPRRIGIKIAQALGYLFGLFPSGIHKRLVKIHHRISPALSKKQLRQRAAQVLSSYSGYWWDVFWLSSKRQPGEIVDIVRLEGEEHFFAAIETAKEKGTGIIFALPHLGSWEIAGAWLGTCGHRPVVVAERLEPPELFDLFTSTRTRVGMTVIAHDDHPTSKLLSALREGEMVCLVADRDIARRGLPVTFFDADKTFPTGPAALAHKTGSVLVPVCTYVSHDAKVTIVFYPPVEVSSQENDRNEVVEKTTQSLAHIFEDMISRDPTQWHVLYDEWEKS